MALLQLLAIGLTIGPRYPAVARTYLFPNTSRAASLHLDSYPVGAEISFPRKGGRSVILILHERISVVKDA
jgi:hypothetical protein